MMPAETTLGKEIRLLNFINHEINLSNIIHRKQGATTSGNYKIDLQRQTVRTIKQTKEYHFYQTSSATSM